MTAMKTTIEAIKEAGLRRDLKVLAQLPQHVWVRNSLNGYLRLYPARVEDG